MRKRTRAFGRLFLAATALLGASPLPAEPVPPASVALTFDTSGSVGSAQLARARDLALEILASLPAGSEVAVLAFDDQSRVVVPSTSKPEEVRERLAGLKVGGRFTALHDALYDASRYVRDAPGARKAIVLITDGVDENSALNLEDGLRVASDAQIPVFAIGVGAHPRERVLRRIAKLTGGDYFAVDHARAADLAALIAALPAGGAAAVGAAGTSGSGSAARGPAAAAGGAARRAPPVTVLPRVVAPSSTGRRAVWIALALTAVAAIALAVAAWRQKRGVATCPECARPLPPDATICPSCAAAPTRVATRSKPPLRESPELSETVLARMNTTEEYLERTITLQERPVLAITRGPRAGEVFELSAQAATSIGRSRANDIQVEDVSVSGQHCRVRPEDGQFVLHDLKSTNGTLVNEKKIVRHVLAEGDVIRLGETSLQYRLEMKRE
jgi:FHA domain-containing protein/von Willebrand factor type A domain-containing protein